MDLYVVTDETGTDGPGNKFFPGAVVRFPKEKLAPGYTNPVWPAGYEDPGIAVYMHPYSVKINPKIPRLWKCVAHALFAPFPPTPLRYANELTVVEEVLITPPTLDQRRAFGLVCAAGVYPDAVFLAWANKYLDGTDSSPEAAFICYNAIKAKYGHAGNAVALAAVSSVVGIPEYPQYQMDPEFYSAAAGWAVWCEYDGKIDLRPAVKFAENLPGGKK